MQFTNQALMQFKKLIIESEEITAGIRFFTTPGCCTPLLQMEISKNPIAGDIVVETGGVTFYVTPEADNILSDITIDFSGETFTSRKN